MKQPLLLITAIIFCQIGFTQQRELDYTNVREGQDFEVCRTHKVMNEKLLNPAFLKIHAADQALIKRRKEEMTQAKQQGTVYTFPVVFHILHNGGNENVSDQELIAAVATLNENYRRLNASANGVQPQFQGMPADVELEFKLATIAPNGTCFNGITRTESPVSFDGDNGNAQINAIVNGNDVYQGNWPGNDYLNFYIVGDAGGAGGYTTKPSSWTQNSMNNGIWVLHTQIGGTVTHEVGHWLNLSHTWGNTNQPGDASNCSSDDGFADTPNTIGVTNCNFNENSCGPIPNVENYMSYSFCYKMFTPEQSAEMRAAATSSIRSNHWSTSNLNAVGAIASPPLCKAEFSGERFTICQGETIDFIDESFNGAVNSWNWTFTGGSPSTNTSQNPSITYNTPGTYAVSLQVSDGSTTLTETKNAYITVVASTGINLPIFEGFENASSVPNADWQVENSDGGTTWQVTGAVSDLGTKSIKLNNYSNNQEGDIDELISMPYDLSNMASVTMTFSYAFAQKNTSNTDKLQIYASDDCGATWAVRKSIAASQMTTTNGSTVSSSFVPTGEQWKDITVTSILGGFLTDGFKYKFSFTSGKGNNLYVDNINIYGTDVNGETIGSPTSIAEFIEDNAVSIYPNPAEENVSVSIDFVTRQDFLRVGIYDLVGKKVLSVYEGNAIKGNQVYDVNTKSLSTGMYLILINNGKNTISKKLIIK